MAELKLTGMQLVDGDPFDFHQFTYQVEGPGLPDMLAEFTVNIKTKETSSVMKGWRAAVRRLAKEIAESNDD